MRTRSIFPKGRRSSCGESSTLLRRLPPVPVGTGKPLHECLLFWQCVPVSPCPRRLCRILCGSGSPMCASYHGDFLSRGSVCCTASSGIACSQPSRKSELKESIGDRSRPHRSFGRNCCPFCGGTRNHHHRSVRLAPEAGIGTGYRLRVERSREPRRPEASGERTG